MKFLRLFDEPLTRENAGEKFVLAIAAVVLTVTIMGLVLLGLKSIIGDWGVVVGMALMIIAVAFVTVKA